MSYTFSRRAFLKYSAATAVAVAGASLLGGCEYQDPQNPITSELQVIAGLKTMKIAGGTCTLEVDIESARANPIPLDPYRFSVAVKGTEDKPVYFSDNWGGVRILDAENSLIQQKKPITIHLAADHFPTLEEGQTVVFKFMPIRENSEYSMTWEITKEVYEEFIANQSTSKN